MNETGLTQKIRDEIRAKGKIPFARFMEMALYDPEGGYYSRSADRIGLGGDFYTSPDVHPIFGRMLSKQIRQMADLIPPDGPFTIVEMGAGKGLLCRDILSGLGAGAPGFSKRFRYRVIERSRAMRARQKEVLRTAGLLEAVEWSEGLDAVRSEGPVTGCILSNELVDSFPVHRVVGTGTGMAEIYIEVSNDRFVESFGRPSTPELEAYLQEGNIRLADGQRAEINLEAVHWMRGVGGALARGFVITVDYGHLAAELYGPHRRKGSLLCYYRHTVNDDPFSRIGEQDITSHVDFTALARAGERAGLAVTGLTNQLNFLMSLGIAQEMEGRDPESPELLSVKRLLARESMGGVFKILIQHKGLTPPLLEGLRFRPYFEAALYS